MKTRLLLAVLLCTVLAVCLALADEAKVPAVDTSVPDTFVLYSFRDDVPEGMVVTGDVAGSIRLFYEQAGGWRKSEFIDRLDISFVSGDERLKSAARVAKSPVSLDDENGGSREVSIVSFQIKPVDTIIDSPAMAVFHLYMESEHCFSEKDITVCCVPWTGYAAFDVPADLPLSCPLSEDDEILYAEAVCYACLGASPNAAVDRIREAFPGLYTGQEELFDIYLHVPGRFADSVPVSDLPENPVDMLAIRGMGIGMDLPLEFVPAAFRIVGEKTAAPGQILHLDVVEADGAGRSFTWSVTNGNAVITAAGNTGADIAVPGDAEGSFSVTVSPDDGSASVSATVSVSATSLFADAGWESEARGAGFVVRLPDGGPWTSTAISLDSYLGTSSYMSEIGEALYAEYIVFSLDDAGLQDDPDSAMQWYRKELCDNLDSDMYSFCDVDGHPAALIILPPEGNKGVDCGVYYLRNNLLLLVKINVRDPSVSVSFSDLAFLASHFSCDGSGAR